MGVSEFTKSGYFIATVFALVVLLVPFGLEQIGETTGWFKFPVQKTIKGWFAAGAPAARGGKTALVVDWERYRQDLEAFTEWAEGRRSAVISKPPREVEVIQVKEAPRPERRMWPVPVVSCTAGLSELARKGYVFISGFDHPFAEGSVIAPSEALCGYEIVCVGERTVWFRAISERDGDVPMGKVKFPEFSRVEGEALVRGSRRYSVRDAFPLGSGGWLMFDSVLSQDGAVFKILDEKRREIASILCVVIGEKGGR